MGDEAVRGSLHDILPVPASVEPGPGGHAIVAPAVAVSSGAIAPVAAELARLLALVTGRPVPVRHGGAAPGDIALHLDSTVEGGPEAYTLDIVPESITLAAPAAAGLVRGVQTLRQLLPARVEAPDGRPSPGWTIPSGRILDRPRYAYRGFMLDVARHFFDVATVKRQLDLAAQVKLNHLHLHLTDDQGWRIAVESWPRLATYGGGTEVGDGPGGSYSREQYQEIVAHAAERHITVVPEIDLPGHTNAALAAYPELADDGVIPRRYTGIEVGFSALVVDRDLTYRFLDDVLGELAAMTPGPYLHIGGDEALTLNRDDYSTIVTRAQEIVAGHGKVAIGWHEAALSKLSPSTVLQFWGISPEAPEVVAAAAQGNRIIMSPANRTYLDMKYDADSPLGLSWAGHIGVADAYDWDPDTYLPGVAGSSVLGVESPLWTETARTRHELEYLAYPRLAAIAELGWSPAASHDWSALRARLAAQAPRWAALGVAFHRSPDVDWR